MLPDLVPREDLLGAVSLSSAQFNLGRVIGPALAGVVLVVGSAPWAFAINALSFGAVVGALALVRLPPRQAAGGGDGIVRRISEGARIALAEPGCRSAIVLIAIVALIGSPVIGLVPAVAIEGFHRGAGDGGAGHRPGHRRRGRGPRARPGGAGASPGAGPSSAPWSSSRWPWCSTASGRRCRGGVRHRGRRRQLHLRALGAEHGGAAPRPRGGARAWARLVHDGARHRLSPGGRRPGRRRRRRGHLGGDRGLGVAAGRGHGGAGAAAGTAAARPRRPRSPPCALDAPLVVVDPTAPATP